VCNKENIKIKELKSSSRRGTISKISSNLAISLVEEYGISFAETERQLGVSTSAVSKIIRRTENRKLTYSSTFPLSRKKSRPPSAVKGKRIKRKRVIF